MSDPLSTPIDPEHPWPGLVAFDEPSQDLFFGRDDPAEELMRFVQRDIVTLLFGRSGLGKTSLLQAGLFPRLRQSGFLPVPIRLDHGADAPPLVDQASARLYEAIDAQGLARPDPRQKEDLWSYLHRCDLQLGSDGNSVPVLVFDQFEELFSLGFTNPQRQPHCAEFVELLADLIEDRLPAWLRDSCESDPARFAELRLDGARYRIIVSLREDYLPALEVLTARSPSFGQNRLRLLAMTWREGMAAVVGPGRALLEDDVAEKIVDELSGADTKARRATAEIDPAILSLFCRELNERRLQAGADKIDETAFTTAADEILNEFYERSMDGIARSVRRFVEDDLVVEPGVRVDMPIDRARKLVDPADVRDIEELVRRRILKLEERQSTVRVELVHDVLLEPLRISRDARIQQELVDAALADMAERRRTKARRIRRRIMVASGAIAALVALVAIVKVQKDSEVRTAADKAIFGCAYSLLASTDPVAIADKLPTPGPNGIKGLAPHLTDRRRCGTSLPKLLQRADKNAAEAISWATSLSSLPSGEGVKERVARIDAVVDAYAIADRDDLRLELASARLFEAQALLGAGHDLKAAAATQSAIDALKTDTNSATNGATANPSQLADLYSRVGEIELIADRPAHALAPLRTALDLRRKAAPKDGLGSGQVSSEARQRLAQGYADLGRAYLKMIPHRPAERAALLKQSEDMYALCWPNSEGAAAGLDKTDELWVALAQRCLSDQAKSLRGIDDDASDRVFRRILGNYEPDLARTPENERAAFYDVLRAVAENREEVFFTSPRNKSAGTRALTFRRWLVLAQRDVFAMSATAEHRDALVQALIAETRLYLALGRQQRGMAEIYAAHTLDSRNPDIKRLRGIGSILGGNACLAKTMFNEAAYLEGEGRTVERLRHDAELLIRAGQARARGIEPLLSRIAPRDPGFGIPARCDTNAGEV
ncbi:hypothetical protein HT136_13245 [Novosphingobium profundi]|uniref:nSTAND1 domain-containing NTPase n=1 Tax=Novosphingobium profundi TaxID=1774954 RepID=UPI001BDB27E1|nr:hypothetical protein [Novosphingobium profundi]MBT0669331.1 hypothetical protein [Novosphingobium profundi]